jgi:ABC-type Fe3+/spermidine/putrescine transport system ATPase subunit
VSDRIAVMNRGSVVQEGSAEDLYQRPASHFVAQFVGRVNLVPGRVLSMNGDSTRVDVLGREIVTRRAPDGIAVGDAVHLALRPEAIQLVHSGDARTIAATVVSSTFLGDKIEYAVRCAGHALQITRYNAAPVQPLADGTPVGLSFADDAVVVLPRENKGTAA